MTYIVTILFTMDDSVLYAGENENLAQDHFDQACCAMRNGDDLNDMSNRLGHRWSDCGVAGIGLYKYDNDSETWTTLEEEYREP